MPTKPETIKTRAGRVVELPTDEEDARINAGIAADPDAAELDDAWFARARPAHEALPPEVFQGLAALRRNRGNAGHRRPPPRWQPPSACHPKCRTHSVPRAGAGRRVLTMR